MKGVTRAEVVADAIRGEIRSGQRLSGERLVELDIAQALDVSQNTVREALHLLESEGWVIKQARRGVYVRSFSPDTAAEVCALIEAIETVALGWALAALDKHAIGGMRRMVAAARHSAYTGDLDAAFDHLLKFHDRIITAAGRPVTVQLLNMLYNQVRLLEALRAARAPRTLPQVEAQVETHEALVRALEAGDLDAARDHLRQVFALYSAATVAALRV